MNEREGVPELGGRNRKHMYKQNMVKTYGWVGGVNVLGGIEIDRSKPDMWFMILRWTLVRTPLQLTCSA